jgi:hypothetical protein
MHAHATLQNFSYNRISNISRKLKFFIFVNIHGYFGSLGNTPMAKVGTGTTCPDARSGFRLTPQPTAERNQSLFLPEKTI